MIKQQNTVHISVSFFFLKKGLKRDQKEKYIIKVIVEEMIPKRKIIKKQYARQKHRKDEEQTMGIDSIMEQLKSIDSKVRHNAVAAIANLQYIPEELLKPQTLSELVIMLVNADTSMICTTMFAINNICEQCPEVIPVLYGAGMHTQLGKLPLVEKHIMRAMLALLTTLVVDVPKGYEHLFEAVMALVRTEEHLSGDLRDLAMEFLLRGKYTGDLPACVRLCATNETSYRMRALATCLLATSSKCHHPDHFALLLNTLDEYLTDISLQHEYCHNIHPIKHNEATEDMMEEEMGKGLTVAQKDEIHAMFMDSLEGLQLMLQFAVDVLENDQAYEDFQEDDDDEMEEQEEPNKKGKIEWEGKLTPHIIECVSKHLHSLKRNTELTFVEGQVIVQLVLSLLQLMPKGDKTVIVPIVEQVIVTMCKNGIPDEALAFSLQTCLSILLSYKYIHQPNIYPYLGSTILKIDPQFKQCWLYLLELYSLFYNPQKTKVSKEQNLQIGKTLKRLIIEIPEKELEEWRCQTIDTVFDVYSNEMFDDTFLNLGFKEVLNKVLEVANTQGVKGKKKKRNKFVQEVLKDLIEFNKYKNKMIKS